MRQYSTAEIAVVLSKPSDTVNMAAKREEHSEASSIHKNRRSALLPNIVMLIAVSLQYFAFGFNSYCINEYTHELIKEQSFPNGTLQTNYSACENPDKSSPAYKQYTVVQQDSADWNLYNTIAAAAPAFLLNVIYPSYSDVYGRKWLFILSTAGLFIKYTVATVVIYTQGSLWIIVLGFLVQGLTGSTYSLLSVTFSQIADTTDKGPHRSFLMSIAEGLLVLSFAVSGFLVGYFIDFAGYFYPSLTASIISFLGLLMTVFLQKESLEKKHRSPPTSVLTIVKRTAQFYTSTEFKGNRDLYILLLASFAVAHLSGVHRGALETIYQLGMPFCWRATQIGYFAAMTQIGQGTLGVGSVKLLQMFLSDESVAMFSTLTNAGSYILEAFATTDVLLYLVAVPALFSCVSTPVIRSLMSSMTQEDKQGSLFASLSIIQSLSWLLGTVVDNKVYVATISFMNGFVFLMLAFISLAASVLIWIFKVVNSRRGQDNNKEEVANDEQLKYK